MKKYLYLFLIGGIGYYLLEVIYRGFSHWSMAITGGICLGILYFISGKVPIKSIAFKALIGCLAITAIEFAVGLIVNVKLGLSVWDYSELPFNLYGQVCLWFTVIWFALCIPVMIIFSSMQSRHRPRRRVN